MTQSPTTEPLRSTLPRTLGGVAGVIVFICGVLLVAMIRDAARNPDAQEERGRQITKQPGQEWPQFPQRQQRALRTVAYWQLTVVRLHNLRFDGVPDSPENGMAFMSRFVAQYGQTIPLARAAPTDHVDPELVAMVSRQLKMDEALHEWNKGLLKILEDPALMPAALRAAQDRMSIHELVSQAQEIAKRDDLPDGIKQNLKVLAQFREELDRMLRETELMQATLQERYKFANSPFPLPAVRPGTSELPAP